ncbi:MAG: hypothetical protein AVDCRST_MAG64-4053 [uncultured Phycisphaerae bacterium]|uniref:Uncharacterized protein n=1 Tax=uncultured Phycisphaerae bacterium TaxID=904963 RepID=A0A6J4QK13_9BACT|nr:MAG: hypothetical protein AVDCRST_MAG64-4053 [uncultured Phycisphaerae bacterium]
MLSCCCGGFAARAERATLSDACRSRRLPSAGRALAAGIPGARYVEIHDASHGVTIAEPARINTLLLDHFAAAPRDGAVLAVATYGASSATATSDNARARPAARPGARKPPQGDPL